MQRKKFLEIENEFLIFIYRLRSALNNKYYELIKKLLDEYERNFYIIN